MEKNRGLFIILSFIPINELLPESTMIQVWVGLKDHNPGFTLLT